MDIAARLEDKKLEAAAIRDLIKSNKLSRKQLKESLSKLKKIRNVIDNVSKEQVRLEDLTEYSTIVLTLNTDVVKKDEVITIFSEFSDSLKGSTETALSLFDSGVSIIVIGFGALLPWLIICTLIYMGNRKFNPVW